MDSNLTTRDIKEALIRQLEQIGRVSTDLDEMKLQLSGIVNSLLSSTVSVTQEVSVRKSSPVPNYNPETDGDYSTWLVSNNID